MCSALAQSSADVPVRLDAPGEQCGSDAGPRVTDILPTCVDQSADLDRTDSPCDVPVETTPTSTIDRTSSPSPRRRRHLCATTSSAWRSSAADFCLRYRRWQRSTRQCCGGFDICARPVKGSNTIQRHGESAELCIGYGLSLGVFRASPVPAKGMENARSCRGARALRRATITR